MIRSMAGRRARVRINWLIPLRLMAMAACGNPALYAGIRPVSPALTAAALGSGWPVWLALAGAACGCLAGGWTADALYALLGDLLTAGLLSLPWARRRLQKEGQREGLTCLAAMLGGSAQLLTLRQDGTTYGLIACLAGALAASMLAPCLLGALSLQGRRRYLLPDEQLSVVLLGALAASGLRVIPEAGEWLGYGAAALFGLLGASCGTANGALAGICAGLALMADEGSLSGAAAFGLCGALAGAVRGMGRPAMSAAMLAGSLLGASLGGMETGALAGTACGCLGYLCLPKGWIARVREAFRPQPVCLDAQALSVRLRREAAQQTGRLARALEGLTEAYAAAQPPLPNEVALIRRMREALCAGCEDYEKCWQGERSQAGRLLCRMMSEAVAGRPLTTAAQLPPDQTRHCRRSTQIDRRVQPVLAQFVEERAEQLRTSGMRTLLCRQTGQAAGILARLSAQLSRPVCVDEDCARLAQAALEKCSLRAGEVLALHDERLELLIAIEGTFTQAQADQAAELLSQELGIRLKGAPCPEEASCLRLIESPGLQPVCACAQATAEGESACGDCCRVSQLPDGRTLLALCDGMGNGEAARAQSKRALELVGRMLMAGVALDATLACVNGALLARGEDCFTTLDLCVLDPARGTADFCKLGAAASAILRVDAIEWIPGGRLPMGVVEEAAPARQRRVLREGETVVLFSDGVADDLKEGQRAWLQAQLPALRALAPQAAAEHLLSQARARDGGKALDDMTVLICRAVPGSNC